MCSRGPFLKREVVLDDLQMSLWISDNLWFCDNECYFKCWNDYQKQRKPWNKYPLIAEKNKWLYVFQPYAHEIPPVGLLLKDLQENSLFVITRCVRKRDWDKSAQQTLPPISNLVKKEFCQKYLKKKKLLLHKKQWGYLMLQKELK